MNKRNFLTGFAALVAWPWKAKANTPLFEAEGIVFPADLPQLPAPWNYRIVVYWHQHDDGTCSVETRVRDDNDPTGFRCTQI